jgi:DNA primase
VLVEGLLDVHHFRARGISNVVALGGTSTAPEMFERLARLGFESVTICLDRDGPGRVATARAVERAVRATRSPAILVLDAEQLAPFKDPDAFLRERGPDAWMELLTKRECGVAWRARELLDGVTPEAPPLARREALGTAGTWLGGLPMRLSLEQEDALRIASDRCGYSRAAVERAFRARFWSGPERDRREREPSRDGLALGS